MAAMVLFSAGPGTAATGHDDGVHTQLAARTPPPAGFRKLTSQQIQRLVIALGEASYPDSNQTIGNSDWTIYFKQSRRADRGKVDFENATLSNYGAWHVKRDKLCIRVKGSETPQPHHGCFAVYAHPQKGQVIAYMPRVRIYRYLMADGVAPAIAGVLAESSAPFQSEGSRVDRPRSKPAPKKSPVVARSTATAPGERTFPNVYTPLKGPQIRRLFEDLGDASYPDDGTGQYSSDGWFISFKGNGGWEGDNTASGFDSHGTWRVDGDRACVRVKNSYGYGASNPRAGCFTIFVNWATGNVAAKFPGRKSKRFIMKEPAYGDIARLKPPPLAKVAR